MEEHHKVNAAFSVDSNPEFDILFFRYELISQRSCSKTYKMKDLSVCSNGSVHTLKFGIYLMHFHCLKKTVNTAIQCKKKKYAKI